MFWITYHLLSGPKRFGELQRLLPQASRQMLTTQLRELEQVGMIHRQIYAVTPPKVEYRLSEVGKTSEPLLRQLSAWGQWYNEQQGGSADWLVSLGSKWKIEIWHHLLSGPKRFGTLQHLLPQVSRRMLTLELRELEQMEIVQRQASLQAFPKPEYALTPLGQSAEPVLHLLSAWGRWTCEQLGLEYDWSIIDQAEERYIGSISLG
jgi:DNA-binding HxlR family transcriptional regulator